MKLAKYVGTVTAPTRAVGGPNLTAATARPVVQTENVLRETMIVTSFDRNLATRLLQQLEVLQPPLLPAEKMDQLVQLLAFDQHNEKEIEELSLLLFDLEDSIITIDDAETKGKLWATIPLKYAILPFSTAKAEELRNELEDLEPAPLPEDELDELIKILEEGLDADVDSYYTMVMEDQRKIYHLRHLLLKLSRAMVNYPQDQLNKVIDNFPIALVTNENIRTLTALKYPNGSPIFNLTDRGNLYAGIVIVMQNGLTKAIEFFNSVSEPSDLSFKSPQMIKAHEKYLLDIRTLKAKSEVQIAEGIFECPRCHNKRINYTEKQIRSADEPTTIFLLCTQCGFSWRQN
jgi:DNA-directed RNA polymerase subunit M/transcription elongation factor TFIIS